MLISIREGGFNLKSVAIAASAAKPKLEPKNDLISKLNTALEIMGKNLNYSDTESESDSDFDFDSEPEPETKPEPADDHEHNLGTDLEHEFKFKTEPEPKPETSEEYLIKTSES